MSATIDNYYTRADSMTEEDNQPETKKEVRDLLNIFYGGSITCNLVMIICAIMVIPLTTQVEDFMKSGNNVALRTNQFVDDWRVVPFIEIITTDTKSCPTGYEPVFERPWGGTVEGCII